jgi:nucleoside-diphosphate-sugar epimerase
MVTGNQGFIGPIVTAMAQSRGYQVTGFDIGFFDNGSPDPSIERQIKADIRDITENDLHGIEGIIHLAALSNDPMGALDPELTLDINFRASVRLAKLAKAAGVKRFIFASSCSLYGASGGDTALDEAAQIQPVSAYAVSKARTEEALLSLADERFSPVFMRNATAYGVGPRPRFDLVVNNLAGWAHMDGVLRILSDGTPWRPLVHIEDIALAALCAVEAPANAVHGQAFNIGHPEGNYQVSDIARAVQAAFPGSKLEFSGTATHDPRSYRVTFDKALKQLPGFSPRWTLERGVEEVARWLKSGMLGAMRFDSSGYIRLTQLQQLQADGRLNEQLRYLHRC